MALLVIRFKIQNLIPILICFALQILLEHGLGTQCVHQQQLAAKQQAHQHIIASSLHHQHADQRQHTKPANVLLYQNNLSMPLNKPLERPSLTLVNKGQQSSNSVADNVSNEKLSGIIEADWFMLGGAGDSNDRSDLSTSESRQLGSSADRNITTRRSTRRSAEISSRRKGAKKDSSSSNRTVFDDEQSDSSDSNEIYDDVEESSVSLAGTQKEPECASQGRYYCTFKEDYPLKLVTEVTKYYKWPLEKLFRDLHAQIMPKLAQDSGGNLVCDSITRVVRPGWARNTNERWLVVINTENYHQYVTEVVCQYGTNSRCNFIPPCYYSSCQQRYNTQKLLVIDPTNPYRGPFMSEFLFPSCCVCYVPSAGDTMQDKYRPSPATIYQRTMQQESAANVNPPQFRPSWLMEENGASSFNAGGLAAPSSTGAQADRAASSSSVSATSSGGNGRAPEPGEIRRRGGEQYRHRGGADSSQSLHQDESLGSAGSLSTRQHNSDTDFPRLGPVEALVMASESAKASDNSAGSNQ